jgi:hypothetical protein
MISNKTKKVAILVIIGILILSILAPLIAISSQAQG